MHAGRRGYRLHHWPNRGRRPSPLRSAKRTGFFVFVVMDATFKILSLDGGGMRGLYTAEVIRRLEEVVGPIGDYFDMICGTSTGGLIALALAKGLTAAEIVEFYKNHGPSIFQRKKFLSEGRAIFQQVVGKGKYSNDYLSKALKEILGDTQMSQAKNLLCIPAYNLTEGKPRVFKFPYPEGRHSATKYGSMVDAALATSAAPTYFPVRFFDNCYYTDGGIFASNPILCGIQDALEYFIGEDKIFLGRNEGLIFNSYKILSLGCLSEMNGWEHTGDTEDLEMSAADWNLKLLTAMTDGQEFMAERLISKLVDATKAKGEYVRIDGSHKVSSVQRKNLKLDSVSKASVQALEQIGGAIGDHYRSRDFGKIANFFLEKKKYQTL